MRVISSAFECRPAGAASARGISAGHQRNAIDSHAPRDVDYASDIVEIHARRGRYKQKLLRAARENLFEPVTECGPRYRLRVDGDGAILIDLDDDVACVACVS
jgi:hypothetical protein